MTELETNWPLLSNHIRRDVQTVNLGSGVEMFRFPFPCINVDANPNVRPNLVVDMISTREEDIAKQKLVLGLAYQVISSHLLEDSPNWKWTLERWIRYALDTKPVGSLVNFIILVPDKALFRKAVAEGQPDNLDHKHEFSIGEFNDFICQKGFNYTFNHTETTCVCPQGAGEFGGVTYTRIFTASFKVMPYERTKQ